MIKMIDEMTKGKTLIVITHDKEIVGIMNKVINLQQLKNKFNGSNGSNGSGESGENE